MVKLKNGRLIVLTVAILCVGLSAVSLCDIRWKGNGSFDIGLYTIRSAGIVKLLSQLAHGQVSKLFGHWTPEEWSHGTSLSDFYTYACTFGPFTVVFCDIARNSYTAGIIYVICSVFAICSALAGAALVFMNKQLAKYVLMAPVPAHLIGFFVWVGMTVDFDRFSITAIMGVDATLWMEGLFVSAGGILAYGVLGALGFMIEFEDKEDLGEEVFLSKGPVTGEDQYGSVTYVPPVASAGHGIVADPAEPDNFGVFSAV